jgi:hypothetical protein
MIFLSIAVSVLASLGACTIFVYLWRRRIRRELETDVIIGKLRTEIGEMVTELNGSAERNIALLENQIRTVNELIDKAGKTANVLQKEKEKHDLASRVYSSLARSRPLALDVEDDDTEEPVPENKISVEPAPVDFDSLSPREKALVLHRKGDGPDSIAAKLDMSRGEVELIISLHDRRH